MDLRTGLIGNPFRLDAEPRKLAVSGDGNYAYVGVQLKYLDTTIQAATDVQRINLQTSSVDQRIEIKDDIRQQHTVLDMQVLPSLSSALAVSRAGPQSDGAIYETAIQTTRSNIDLGYRSIQ